MDLVDPSLPTRTIINIVPAEHRRAKSINGSMFWVFSDKFLFNDIQQHNAWTEMKLPSVGVTLLDRALAQSLCDGGRMTLAISSKEKTGPEKIEIFTPPGRNVMDSRRAKDSVATAYDQSGGLKPQCAFCATQLPIEGKNRCSRCKCTYYCSREHQLQHWARHKTFCANIVANGVNALAIAPPEQLPADKVDQEILKFTVAAQEAKSNRTPHDESEDRNKYYHPPTSAENDITPMSEIPRAPPSKEHEKLRSMFNPPTSAYSHAPQEPKAAATASVAAAPPATASVIPMDQ